MAEQLLIEKNESAEEGVERLVGCWLWMGGVNVLKMCRRCVEC